MATIQQQLLEKMPAKMAEFLDTLNADELAQVEKMDRRLFAKIYQAGAVFAIDAGLEIAQGK